MGSYVVFAFSSSYIIKQEAGGQNMNTVKQVLESKGNDVCIIESDNNAFKALQIMSKHNIGSILVTNESEEVIGIFTERD